MPSLGDSFGDMLEAVPNLFGAPSGVQNFLRGLTEPQIQARARKQAFQNLPFRLMGLQEDQAGEDRVARKAKVGFRAETMENAQRLRGMQKFALRPEFNTINRDEVVQGLLNEAVKTWGEILHWFRGSKTEPKGGGKK